MYIPKKEIESRIKTGDKVLDIGSWNDVFPRANVIIDVNPYETRKNKYPDEKEHFTKDTWILSDVNKMETWARFADKEFDFVICSHLLEDIRDPMFVCEQLIRVAKSGYIEVPTRYRECARASANDTVSGYDHHRWLVDVIDESLVFTAKLHWAHTVDYLTEPRRNYLHFHNFHYFGVFWDTSFHFYERCPKGELLEGANLLYQFDKLDITQLHELGHLPCDSGHRPRGNMLWWDQFALPIEGEGAPVTKQYGNMLWVDQFSLPIESEEKDIVQSYMNKYGELCKASENTIADQKSEIERLNDSLNEVNMLCANQTKEIERLNNNTNAANMICENQKTEILALKSSLDEVFCSSSWRLTKPLRGLRRILAGGMN